MFPNLSRLKMLRTWGGIMDMSMDGSPVIDKSHIEGLYLNFGWCYGGFKATPVSGWTFAYTIAQDKPHKLNEKFTLNRFNTGHLIDEKGVFRHSVLNDLPLGRNIDEMLRMIDALDFHSEHGDVCPANWQKGKTAMNPSDDGMRKYMAEEASNL